MKNTQKKAELLDKFVQEILATGIKSDRENDLIKRYREIHQTIDLLNPRRKAK